MEFKVNMYFTMFREDLTLYYIEEKSMILHIIKAYKLMRFYTNYCFWLFNFNYYILKYVIEENAR